MVMLRLTEMELQELRMWASQYKKMQEETGVKWDEQQQKIVIKMNKLVGLDENDEPLPPIHSPTLKGGVSLGAD